MSVRFLESNEIRFSRPTKRTCTVLVDAPSGADTAPRSSGKKRRDSSSMRSTLLVSDTPKMRVPANDLNTDQLRGLLTTLATTAAEYIVRPKRAGKRRLDSEQPSPPEPSGGLVPFDSEMAACNGGRKGPYAAMSEVVVSLLQSKPKAALSTACVEHQYALLRACLATDELFDPSRSGVAALADLLERASILAAQLFSELTRDWKQGLEPEAESGRVLYKPVDGAVQDDFWNWNPTKLTYRALSVRNGRHVTSYKSDFVCDFYTRGKAASEPRPKDNPLRDHPFIKEQLEEMLKERDDAIKRGGSQMSSSGKRRRHPCVGPLEVEDYFLHEPDIRCVHEQRAGADVAAARLKAAFPSNSIDSVVRQHDFEERYAKLCSLFLDAFFEYSGNGSGNIFGERYANMHGVFCLTTMQYNKGDKFEEVNSKETWFLRLLNRLMVFDEPDLKTKNYKAYTEFSPPTESEQRRHATNRSVDGIFLQMSGRINGWVQAEFLKGLTTFFLVRVRAFEKVGLMKVMTRDDRLRWLSISRNECDSFDDLIRSRAVDRPGGDGTSSCLTSWDTPGSLTEEANLVNDAVTLAITVVGREKAGRAFPELLEAAGIRLPGQCGDADSSSGADSHGHLAVRDSENTAESGVKARGRTPEERLERLDGAEAIMGHWLSLRQRCDKKTLTLRIRTALQHLRVAMENVGNAVRITAMVAAEYKRVRQLQFAERSRIMNMADDVQLSADERMLRDKDQGAEETDAVASAVETTFARMRFDPFCTYKESVAALVGTPPAWNWEIDAGVADETAVSQSHHASFVRGLEGVLSDYARYIDECDDSATMIDLVTPVDAYLQMLVAPKSFNKVAGEQTDWVGFSESIGRVRGSKQVLDCIQTRVTTMRSHPKEFLSVVSEVVHSAFLLALEWAGVFSPNSQRLRPTQKSRLGLSVVYILKVLSLAAAHGAICASGDQTDDRPVLFTTSTQLHTSSIGRVDISSPDAIVRFAEASNSNWKCVCTLASLTKLLLVYNREVTFDSDSWNHSDAIQGVVSVSFCEETFLIVHEDAVNAHRLNLGAYRASLCADVDDYPHRHDWTFHDEHWTHPTAFKVLLTWLPDAAHDTLGFFPISGVRDRPDKKNGFLNVTETLPYTADPRAEQYWKGVCEHTLAATHGRLPTPPWVSSGDERDPAFSGLAATPAFTTAKDMA